MRSVLWMRGRHSDVGKRSFVFLGELLSLFHFRFVRMGVYSYRYYRIAEVGVLVEGAAAAEDPPTHSTIICQRARSLGSVR